MPADPELVAILRDALEAAERGEITDLFVLYGLKGEYGAAWHTGDFDDLVLQLGTEHIRLHAAGKAERDDTRH